ncbi:MAG: hypothetical protein PUB89_15240 [Oscillospiraceae bacterium]|nr:hypothetical protein [Oscillospiraceae bacterium]MDD6084163.1 hypothetical protein [Oscillospiraceae bacterium]
MKKLVDINIQKEVLADRIAELGANYMNLMEEKNIKFPDDKENVIVNLALELKKIKNKIYICREFEEIKEIENKLNMLWEKYNEYRNQL